MVHFAAMNGIMKPVPMKVAMRPTIRALLFGPEANGSDYSEEKTRKSEKKINIEQSGRRWQMRKHAKEAPATCDLHEREQKSSKD